ncbi:hypothetical protein GO986_00785 [Deinococcus sp. HMF7620]|uniref:Uncharacterized protein n=1 Tax=Deinococcus arboris TaxID=2682977 RepID=A0A7C9I812_9DEIO|nr:hypothetical protein [Deinococcus arboris]MVN85306.1 hypothetical protein [Deinococcus arboris]
MTGRHTVPTAQMPTEGTAPIPTIEPEVSATARQAALPDASFFKFLPRVLMATNAILLLLLAFQLFHRPKYEYMTASPDDLKFEEEMNAMGAQGWKADSCRRASSENDFGATDFSYECVMSRPKLGW